MSLYGGRMISMATRNGNIPRLALSSPEELLGDYVDACRPVILTNLFEGQRIRELSSQQDVRQHLGDMPLMTQLSYGVSLKLSPAPENDEAGFRRHALAEYLDFIAREPSSARMCMEQPVPSQLAALLEVPGYCLDEGKADDLEMLLFVGNQGNYALLHFDADHRHVLLYQVFGTKKLILINPRQVSRLDCWGNVSMVPINQLDDGQLATFCEQTQALHGVLHPGEAILIPALWWHYVDYLETGMSVSVRFGRNKIGAYFQKNIYPDARAQNVGSLFLGRSPLTNERASAFQYLQSICERDHEDAARRHLAVSLALAGIGHKLLPELKLEEVLAARPTYRQWESAAAKRFYEDRAAARVPAGSRAS